MLRITLLVTSQNPDFDVGLGQLLDGLRHPILELVLYGSGPEQLHTHTHYTQSNKPK